MPLPKGRTNNLNGRPKGVPNKITRQTKEAMTRLFKKNFKLLQFNMKELEPKDHVAAMLKLAEFIIPKKASMDVNVDRMTFAEQQEMIYQIIEYNEQRELQQIQLTENPTGNFSASKGVVEGEEDC